MEIKILGSGCPNCKRLERNTREVLAQMGIEANITKVTSYADIMTYDVLATPGLVINEKVVSFGRIPSNQEISSMIATAVDEAGD